MVRFNAVVSVLLPPNSEKPLILDSIVTLETSFELTLTPLAPVVLITEPEPAAEVPTWGPTKASVVLRSPPARFMSPASIPPIPRLLISALTVFVVVASISTLAASSNAPSPT